MRYFLLLLSLLPQMSFGAEDCRATSSTQVICWVREAETVHLRLHIHGDQCLENKKSLSVSILDNNRRWQKYSDAVAFYYTSEAWQFTGSRFNLFINLNDFYFIRNNKQPRYSSILNDYSARTSTAVTCILNQDRNTIHN